MSTNSRLNFFYSFGPDDDYDNNDMMMIGGEVREDENENIELIMQ